MVRIRRFEERCVELYSAAEIRGFMHLYIGEEAIAAGVLQALDPGDAVVSTYREHGHALARGVPMDAILAEMYGRTTGCSRGRGGSMHLFDASRRFYGGNAIVGGGLPIATGLALAASSSSAATAALTSARPDRSGLGTSLPVTSIVGFEPSGELGPGGLSPDAVELSPVDAGGSAFALDEAAAAEHHRRAAQVPLGKFSPLLGGDDGVVMLAEEVLDFGDLDRQPGSLRYHGHPRAGPAQGSRHSGMEST
ncbi:hypothetical protein H4696_003471 [Amycolatopsis lexingtonensis]|uniref:Dehydrogenase E1 component domain-containing protein n=2 Tax=Amycolatopsis lexingtonensis TaxID=218822 RepID=A0ABR9HZM2_9PSEU|nr:thiamine pyrophosphate-dependent enzyme [Amycolatopsis lexingtonensis]MBE1496371.1 hypothetical protein [Amycolatopsis lexingtonensis]